MDAVTRLIIRAAIDCDVSADKATKIAQRFNDLASGAHNDNNHEPAEAWYTPLLEKFDTGAPKSEWQWMTLTDCLLSLGSDRTSRASLTDFGRYLASFGWPNKRSNGRKYTLVPPITGGVPVPLPERRQATSKYPIQTLGLREHLDIPYDQIGNRGVLQNNIRAKASGHGIVVSIKFIDPEKVCRVWRIA